MAAAASVAALVLGACSSTVRDLDAVEVLGQVEQPTVAVVVVEPSPVPTATAGPTATPTPPPTPTPLPTPTPVPQPLIPTDVIRLAIDDNFAALDELGARYSYAVHVDGVGYIEQRRPVLELRPASNQKVITAFGALELLPIDFRFTTQMRLDGQGRLHVVAGGDPTLTRANVEVMVAQVADHLARLESATLDGSVVDSVAPGVPDAEPTPAAEPGLEITELVVDVSYFDNTRTGPGWPDRYVPTDVGPMSALMIDDNQHRGDAAFIADPDLGNAELIAELLEEAGVTVTGEVRVGTAAADAELVAQHQSPSLRTLVSVILSASDNEIADALVRQIALDHADSSSIIDGKQVIHDRLEGFGIDLGPVDGDGSGLSRRNRLSARELVEVLLLARDQSWWPTVENGLANAGVTGTLQERLEVETTIGNVRAKTGTLVDVAALSGYLTTVDGGSVTFSLIIEAEDRDEARDALDRIVVALASATLPQLTED